VGSLFIIGEILVGWAWWLVAHFPEGRRPDWRARQRRGEMPSWIGTEQPYATKLHGAKADRSHPRKRRPHSRLDKLHAAQNVL